MNRYKIIIEGPSPDGMGREMRSGIRSLPSMAAALYVAESTVRKVNELAQANGIEGWGRVVSVTEALPGEVDKEFRVAEEVH